MCIILTHGNFVVFATIQQSKPTFRLLKKRVTEAIECNYFRSGAPFFPDYLQKILEVVFWRWLRDRLRSMLSFHNKGFHNIRIFIISECPLLRNLLF